ncbi:MAG: glutathione synthase [Myxococcota bacterium]|nr:glutathione synthase [Myxococcota bacterium]
MLFVMDPLSTINVAGDSTYVMMLEATRRGWTTFWCTPDDLQVIQCRPIAQAEPVSTSDEAPFFTTQDSVAMELGEFDCIWMRKDPPFDIHYIFSTYILDLAPPTTLVLNDPRSIKCANEKMYALQWPDLCPPTTVTNRIQEILDFTEEHQRVVVKPWDGNGGRGVLVTHADDGNLRAIAELMTSEEHEYCIVQRYLPEIKTGDKRIILIDGDPLGAFLRVPSGRDHRGNMHVGARVVSCELSERDHEICRQLGPRLKKEGLLFVGIDVIGDFLTEINVTSPTGLREIAQLSGRFLERDLLDALEEKIHALRS